MPILNDYAEFDGRHWETGSVRNVLAYQGVTAPHTGEPISEALLMGISGGTAFGYFVFDYQATDPFVSLLPRNTFDPLDTLLERLGIPQERLHTASAEKAERNLIQVLEAGRPAIVWADLFMLSYNGLNYDEQMWSMNPIVVYGYQDGKAYVADRAAVPLKLPVEELAGARARIKKDKHRVLALEPPNFDKLSGAVQQGIWDCISLYTEAPPKGGRDSFGFAAYEKLASMLTNTRNKQSWERLLAPGRRMYAALAGYGYQPGAFGWARTFPSNQVDDKALYAKFLVEAAEILHRPGLREAAEPFRAASEAWQDLSDRMLPDEVPLFAEARQLMLDRKQRFIAEGAAALTDIQAMNSRLKEIFDQVADQFPLSSDQVVELREELAERVLAIAEIEREGITMLQSVMS